MFYGKKTITGFLSDVLMLLQLKEALLFAKVS